MPIHPDCSPAYGRIEVSFVFTYETDKNKNSRNEKRTLAQPLHQLPARPPPSSASAASTHLVQFSPIRPMMVINEMLYVYTITVSQVFEMREWTLT